MTTATKAKGLHAKLAEVMAEAGRIPKNGSYKQPGEYGHFKFVQVGDAADSIRTALGTRGVSMLPSAVEVVGETEHATKSGGTMTTVTIRTTWTLVDGESGETATIQSIGTGADAGDKASPKAQTNAMKYALLMGFLLSTGDDPETSDSSDRRPRQSSGSASGAPEAPEPSVRESEGGLIGVASLGKSAPVDGELRETPDGWSVGFVIGEGREKVQVVATGDWAQSLATVLPTVMGERVQVYGPVHPETMRVGQRDVKFLRMGLVQIKTDDWVMPPKEVESIALFPDAQTIVGPDEAAAIIEREKAEAAVG